MVQSEIKQDMKKRLIDCGSEIQKRLSELNSYAEQRTQNSSHQNPSSRDA
jgi:hypothetical protein